VVSVALLTNTQKTFILWCRLSFVHKAINCMLQTSSHLIYAYTVGVLHVHSDIGHHVETGIKTQRTQLISYFTTVSQQNVSSYQTCRGWHFDFRQNSALARHAFNAVKLLERKLSTTVFFNPLSNGITRNVGSILAWITSTNDIEDIQKRLVEVLGCRTRMQHLILVFLLFAR